jgi:hypothetical protein
MFCIFVATTSLAPRLTFAKYIRKFNAAVLLLVFTISMLPKVYFHDAVADHEDKVSCRHLHEVRDCLSQKVLDCDTNTLVVTSSFLFAVPLMIVWRPLLNPAATATYSSSLIDNCFLRSEGRGPPQA